MTLHFHNTLTRRKEPFLPADPANVRMYVCGPTVYQAPHLGNARSVVIYDVLFRLLREVYGAERVTYARNITDVDDKINAGAKERGVPIRVLTDEVTAEFHADMAALGCLPPTIEPRATGHMPQIIAMIEALVENGHAYVAEGHVLFAVTKNLSAPADTLTPTLSLGEGEGAEENPLPHRGRGQGEGVSPFHWHYGMLSRRSTDEMIAGARVEVAPYKKNPGDFVLWKPSPEGDDASSRFESPWGIGRPGWHIECSAMATAHLGVDFDLHGGGADLMFPHHENELAQSCCANPGSRFAGTWVHNGFLTVDGEKMSKSLGNFITVRDLLERGVHGEVIRFALLYAHYRKPLNWTEALLEAASFDVKRISEILHEDESYLGTKIVELKHRPEVENIYSGFVEHLADDINFSDARRILLQVAKLAESEDRKSSKDRHYFYHAALGRMVDLIGLDTKAFFDSVIKPETDRVIPLFKDNPVSVDIQKRIDSRIAAKREKNWAEADRLRDELKAEGILLMDRPDGTTEWRRV